MFSGISNQVSNLFGKKNEDNGTKSPADNPSATSARPGAEPTANKKDTLAAVKSQMSGWLGSGIPGLRGTAPTSDAPAGPPADTAPEEPQSAPGEEKDDDHSGATGGADSNPGSAAGTPTEEKAGQESFGNVSTKALEGAKNFGGFLFSAVNKAGKTVAEAGAKIKKTVEENRLIADLNKEQEAFIAGKRTEKGQAVAPWVGAPNEDALREECLSLSLDERNFMRPPPEGVEFNFDFKTSQEVAKIVLALDPNLEKMRFELVPKAITEETFWRNYFYRISVLRQGYELMAMANQDTYAEGGNPSDIPDEA